MWIECDECDGKGWWPLEDGDPRSEWEPCLKCEVQGVTFIDDDEGAELT